MRGFHSGKIGEMRKWALRYIWNYLKEIPNTQGKEMGEWENGRMGKWENGRMGEWENVGSRDHDAFFNEFFILICSVSEMFS